MRRQWLAAVVLLAGCSTSAYGTDAAAVHVITTTGILADLARHVGGDRARVTSLVPEGGDPHTYEPTLRDVRNVVYADLAFSNYALLEEHSVIKTLDANLRTGARNVSLAEESVKYAADLIPLVENVSLDAPWLGLRVRGSGAALGATRSSDVLVSATGIRGPGRLVGYLTGSFGRPEVYFDSDDGGGDNTATLPPDAHTHMTWAFTEPGRYTLDLRARLAPGNERRPVEIGRARYTFAVGVNPYRVPGANDVLSAGHADLTADLDGGGMSLHADTEHRGTHRQREFDPARTVIEVPARTAHEVSGDPAFRFLGRPGATVYELPQAVLGAHVHGEIDPHLWQDVGNAMAYVKLMRDELSEVDPDGATTYVRNANRYLTELERTDAYVRRTVAAVPKADRQLVTTHDAFGYLAHAYGLRVAGFVTPNPATEPSLAERRRLSDTIRRLHVPAVFLEPNLAARSSPLVQLAGDAGVRVCRIYGDSFDDRVTSYVAMMRANADSIRECLT